MHFKILYIVVSSLSTMLIVTCAKKTATVAISSLPSKVASVMPAIDSVSEDIDSTMSIDSKCHIEGPVVMQLKEQVGYVGYRANLWYISYSPPLRPNEMSDSQYSGFVCNMPEAFKGVGRKVKFSGNYHHAYKYIPKAHAGDTPLYLVLKKIRWGDAN